MIFWKVDTPDKLQERLDYFREWVTEHWDWDKPLTWEPKPYTNSRSLSANALMHVWFREMAAHFSGKGSDLTEAQAKELMKYKFLGTEDRLIGKTLIPHQLRSTSRLSSGEMKEFLDQIQAWCADHGLNLTNPQDSEYAKWCKEHGQ